MYSKVIDEFEGYFGQKAEFLVLSSGRVNLIGEHVDYHEGVVLPCAINLKNVIVGSSSSDYITTCRSLRSNSTFRVDISGSNIFHRGSTEAYIYGVCRSIIDSGYFIRGVNFLIDGNLPIGSGLSSSASFCCGLTELISQIYRLNIGRSDIAKIAKMAENNYAQVPCGIMDQMAIVYGKKGKLVRIDCRDLNVSYCDMIGGISIVIVNTMIKRQLAKSEYEKRQRECQTLLSYLKRTYPQIKSLRDVDEKMLLSVKEQVDETIFRRGKYVIEELKRVERVIEAMQRGDKDEIGRLFYEGHRGLRDEYEVSCKELDYIVDATYKFKGALAARMTGAGFGGCAVTLIKEGLEDEFMGYISEGYRSTFNRDCEVYIAGSPSDGLVSIKL